MFTNSETDFLGRYSVKHKERDSKCLFVNTEVGQRPVCCYSGRFSIDRSSSTVLAAIM